jgi:hypothetical protein
MLTPEHCTPRCLAFLAALSALCDTYGVTLTSRSHERLEIWDRDEEDSSGLDWGGLQDCTDPSLDFSPSKDT